MKSLVVAVCLAALTIPAMAVAQDTMQPIPNPPAGEHHNMMHNSKHHHPLRHAWHKVKHGAHPLAHKIKPAVEGHK